MELSKLFDDAQLLIVAHLQAAHLKQLVEIKREVEKIKAELDHERRVLCDVISICEYEGIDISVCDSCRCIQSSEDMFSCDECHYTLCIQCNAAEHATGSRDINEDEVCLWCEEKDNVQGI